MKEVIARRVELLMKAKNNIDLQDVEKEACRRSILYFFRNYLYTDKNTTLFTDDQPSCIPFVPFEFQEELIEQVWNSIIT